MGGQHDKTSAANINPFVNLFHMNGTVDRESLNLTITFNYFNTTNFNIYHSAFNITYNTKSAPTLFLS